MKLAWSPGEVAGNTCRTNTERWGYIGPCWRAELGPSFRVPNTLTADWLWRLEQARPSVQVLKYLGKFISSRDMSMRMEHMFDSQCPGVTNYLEAFIRFDTLQMPGSPGA